MMLSFLRKSNDVRMYSYPYLDNAYLSQSFFLLSMNSKPIIHGFFSIMKRCSFNIDEIITISNSLTMKSSGDETLDSQYICVCSVPRSHLDLYISTIIIRSEISL